MDPSAAESSTVEPAPDQVRRKAILRSKSDVGPSRFAPDLLPAVPPEFTGDVPLDLDQFFDTIGQHGKLSCVDVMINNSGRSSPVYFSSVSSVDSYCKRRHVDNLYESSDSEDMAATLQRRLLGNLMILLSIDRLFLSDPFSFWSFSFCVRESTRNGRAIDRGTQRSNH